MQRLLIELLLNTLSLIRYSNWGILGGIILQEDLFDSHSLPLHLSEMWVQIEYHIFKPEYAKGTLLQIKGRLWMNEVNYRRKTLQVLSDI